MFVIKINKCYTCREHTCGKSMHRPKEADFCELVSSGGDSYFQVKRVRGHSRYLSARSSTQSDIMLANTVTSELALCLQCSRRTQRHGHGLQHGFHTHRHTYTHTHTDIQRHGWLSCISLCQETSWKLASTHAQTCIVETRAEYVV